MSRSASSITGKTKHKLVFLGDQGTGKSSIIQRFVNDNFDDKNNPTIGIDFLAKNFVHEGRNYRLQLWDTAGQQRFKSLIPGYLRDAICGILVYDVMNMESMENLYKWLELFRQHKTCNAITVVCANKIDLRKEKTDVQTRAMAFAASNGLLHFELSAKTGQNINTLFGGVINAISSIPKEGKTSVPESINEPTPTKNKMQFTQLQSTTRSQSIKLTPEEIEEDKKLTVERRIGCCKL